MNFQDPYQACRAINHSEDPVVRRQAADWLVNRIEVLADKLNQLSGAAPEI